MCDKFLEFKEIHGRLHGIYEHEDTDRAGNVIKRELVAIPIRTQGEIEVEKYRREDAIVEAERRAKEIKEVVDDGS